MGYDSFFILYIWRGSLLVLLLFRDTSLLWFVCWFFIMGWCFFGAYIYGDLFKSEFFIHTSIIIHRLRLKDSAFDWVMSFGSISKNAKGLMSIKSLKSAGFFMKNLSMFLILHCESNLNSTNNDVWYGYVRKFINNC